MMGWRAARFFSRKAVFMWLCPAILCVCMPGCNSPYPDGDEGKRIYYTTFFEEPKHLDPARSYSSGEAYLMRPVLEPPFHYHYLKRPYELVPCTATAIPSREDRVVTFGGEAVTSTVYRIELRRGIRYQDHACFVEVNRRLTEKDAPRIWALSDFEQTATRELLAADYANAIRRLADPRLACPIFATLAKNLLGMSEYRRELERRLDEERKVRRERAGSLYSLEEDEKYNPIRIDYSHGADGFPFVREIDRYTFEVVLKEPYPQMLYWMAMTFFAPVPPEAIEFFDQPLMRRRSILLDRSPVGTGPFKLLEYDPTNQLVFERNANFREERYPDLPRPDRDDAQALANYEQMKAAGMLEDAGKRVPMIDRIVFRMEKESIPRWNKFLQGYYDTSGISSDIFDQAVTLTSHGDSVVSDAMARRGIRLLTSYPMTVSYYAFNMNDSVVGGYTAEKRKLRQAISIAFNVEEEISIFANGRGIPAHSPIPAGIFGNEEGEAGINPVVYRWDAQQGQAVRRSLDEAKKLLAEAGYPDGYGADGQRLTIRYAAVIRTGEVRTWITFVKKQFEKLNIRLIIENTDYNRFRDKVLSGNYQVLHWGWIADYPDPENFLFLLYGPNGKTVSGGENVPNYRNDEYDRLFVQMQSMDNTPERLAIIRKMLAILREDAPWLFDYHPVAYGLYHSWCRNAYPHALAYNSSMYLRIDTSARTAYRKENNAPRVLPVIVFVVFLLVVSLPAVRSAARNLQEV